MSLQVKQDAYDYFHFQLSCDIAIIALSLFLAVSLAILVLTIKMRAWFMLIPTIFGLMEMGDYASRIRMLSPPSARRRHRPAMPAHHPPLLPGTC